MGAKIVNGINLRQWVTRYMEERPNTWVMLGELHAAALEAGYVCTRSATGTAMSNARNNNYSGGVFETKGAGNYRFIPGTPASSNGHRPAVITVGLGPVGDDTIVTVVAVDGAKTLIKDDAGHLYTVTPFKLK